jgi:protein-S-isoprenylcysteine O-methyltransferase Ste14
MTHLVCPRCGGDNLLVQAVTETRTKRRGCLGWALWLLFAIGVFVKSANSPSSPGTWALWILFVIYTLGLIISLLLTNSRLKSRTHSEAVCQNCGHHWRV